MLVWVLPASCASSESASSESSRCPFGECTVPASTDASVASPSAALVAKVQSTDDGPAFVDFGVLFGEKLAANSIAIAEDLTACDDAATVSGVVLEVREAGALDVAIDTAMACWATSTSQSPSAVVLVTVTLPWGLEEQLLIREAAISGSNRILPEVAASWAVGSSWQYPTNNNDGS